MPTVFTRSRRIALGVCLIAALAAATGRLMAARDTADEERRVLAAEQQRFAALLSGDVTALRALMREDCAYTHSTGVLQDREAYLAPIAAGRTRYVAASGSEQRVRIIGDTAIVNGRATLNARVEGDPNLRVNDLRYTNVWIRSHSAWRLAAWHASRVQ